MANQLLIDLYDCNVGTLNDLEQIRDISHHMIEALHASMVEECYHQFDPIGITYIAVITTSHFSIHTWPEHKYAAVDIFSCDESLPEEAAKILITALEAKDYKVRSVDREIERRQ